MLVDEPSPLNSTHSYAVPELWPLDTVWRKKAERRTRGRELSPLVALKARPSPLNCENEYAVLPLGEKLQSRQ